MLGCPYLWGARGTNEFWYYTEGNETRGPIGLEELIKHLSQLPTVGGILVWREDLADRTAAENVREIVEKLVRPPPLPTMKAKQGSPAEGDAPRNEL